MFFACGSWMAGVADVRQLRSLVAQESAVEAMLRVSSETEWW